MGGGGLRLFSIWCLQSIVLFVSDTEGIYKECIDKALEKYGKKYTDDVRIKVVGTKEQDTCRIIVEELKLPTSSTEFADELFEYYKSSLGRAEIKPGIILQIVFDKRLIHFL